MPLRKQAQAARDAHVLVATPGRLQDLVDRQARSRSTRVSILVLDEADRMLDMGFKPQVDRIVRLLPSKRQTMFFSATLDGEVGELARRYTHFPARFDSELPEERRSGEVDHQFIPVTPENKVQTLIDLLPGDEGLALVFVRTKAGADRLVEKLRRHDVDAVAIHGDKAQVQRERALARFDSGKVRTLVATDVAARGLDVEDITHVINFDPPEEPDAYTHRVGRTGRAGRGGTGITLVLPEQQADVSRVARLQGQTERFEESGMTMARPRLVYTSRRGTGLEVVTTSGSPPSRPRRSAAELEELEGPRRTEVVAAIKKAREFGDLSENFEYHAAKNEQGLLEARIRTLRAPARQRRDRRGGDRRRGRRSARSSRSRTRAARR